MSRCALIRKKRLTCARSGKDRTLVCNSPSSVREDNLRPKAATGRRVSPRLSGFSLYDIASQRWVLLNGATCAKGYLCGVKRDEMWQQSSMFVDSSHTRILEGREIHRCKHSMTSKTITVD